MKYVILLITMLSLTACNTKEKDTKIGEMKACEIGTICQGEPSALTCCEALCIFDS